MQLGRIVDVAISSPGDRAGQVARVLLTGLAVVAGLAALVVLTYFLGKALGWMVARKWPVAAYVATAAALIIGGYVFDSNLLYYGIGALVLPLVLLTFMAVLGF